MSNAFESQPISTPAPARTVPLFEPFTGRAIDVAEGDFYAVDDLEPCILCGELTEPRHLATLTPPHVCDFCMDEEAEAMDPIRAREIA